MTMLMPTPYETLLKGSVIYSPQDIITLEPLALDRTNKSLSTFTAHARQETLKPAVWLCFATMTN